MRGSFIALGTFKEHSDEPVTGGVLWFQELLAGQQWGSVEQQGLRERG
jgi:hypothetical protein